MQQKLKTKLFQPIFFFIKFIFKKQSVWQTNTKCLYTQKIKGFIVHSFRDLVFHTSKDKESLWTSFLWQTFCHNFDIIGVKKRWVYKND